MITFDEDVPVTPRFLRERTGKHYCTLCLAEISWEEFDDNDSLCDGCTEVDEHPSITYAPSASLLTMEVARLGS